MFCKECVIKATQKLIPNDLVVLELLKSKGACTVHFSFSKETIQEETKLSLHHLRESLLRLEILGMICLIAVGSKSHKYYITEEGRLALEVVENSIGEIESII